MKFSTLILLALVASANATKPTPPKPDPVPPAPINATANSNANANAAATAIAAATASNDNAVSVTHQASAPALGQGSFAIAGCQVAGNAGGSNSGGAGFLGFAFTTEQCYDLQLAAAYQALGAYSAACQVLNLSKAGQRAAKRGVTLPTCAAPIPLAAPQPVVVNVAAAKCETEDFVRKSDVSAALETERSTKAFKQCVAK